MGRFDFEGVLESLAGEDASAAQGAKPSAAAKFGGAAAPLGVAVNATYADALRREGEEAGPADPAQAPTRDATQIERELALSADLSVREIGRRRREFLWDHHPDRSPAGPEAANRQAAIANMLFDKAIENRRRK